MATPKGNKPAAGKPNDIDALIAKGKSNYSESIDAKNKSTFDYDDGKYPQFWNSFNIQEGANGWGVLTVWLFLDEPYKDKLYYQWYSIMSNREGEEGLFDSRLLEFLEKVTGTKAEDLDFGSRDELEAILKDAWKQDQVWSAQFSTRKGKDRNGDDTEFKNWKLLKKLDDYVLPKKGKAKPGAAASKAKSKKNECPFEVDDDVTIEQGEGTVVSIDEENETANVKVGKKTHKDIAWDDIIPVDDDDDEDDDEATFEEGQTVRFNVTEGKGKNKTTTEHEGVVTEVDEENETLTVKVGKGKNAETYEVEFSDVLEDEDDEDDDEDEDDEDQVLDANDNPVEVGDTVKWSVTTGKGKSKTTEEFEGEVLEIGDDEDHTLTVKVGEEGKGKAKKDVTEEVAASEVEVQSEDDEDEDSDEDEDEGAGYEEGQTVAFTIPADKKKKREEFSGEGVITEVDEENETLTVKVGKGKAAKDYEVEFDWVDSDEDDADEDGDDEDEGGDDELIPGKTKVEYKHPKSKMAARGTIVSVDDKANTCKVKTGAQTIEISQDDIAFILTD